MTASQADIVAMIARLVGFDTTSRLSNLDLIHDVAGYLKEHGIESHLIHDDEGSKANLYASVGPADVPGIVLSGHTDVVPVDGQNWKTDPFVLARHDGALYGRGTADMKSFIAIALALVPEMKAAGLKKPLHFALSYDEEVGCLGVRGMIRRIEEIDPKPAIVIVGEPTSMKVVNAHKGVYAFRTRVHGLEAHSSATDQGVNAIMYAAELIGFLHRLAREMADRRQAHSRFDPPYTSVHVGTVKGGTALNIIPKECSFVWEYRLLPGEDESEVIDRFRAFSNDEVLPRMRDGFEAAEIETEVVGRVAALMPEENSPAETLVLRLANSNETDAVSYGTEAGLFQEAEMPAVVCGPGDITDAHKPDEFIRLEQVDACAAFLRRLIAYAAA